MIQKHNYYILIFLALLLISCKKFVKIDPPNSTLFRSVVFDGEATAVAVQNRNYLELANTISSKIEIAAGLSADEFTNYSQTNEYIQFYSNGVLSNNLVVFYDLWAPLYRRVYDANSVLEGLEASSIIKDPVRSQLVGEAKFMRAFAYFYLVNLFGDIPLLMTTNYEINSSSTRTPSTQIYNQIIADLKDAQTLLSDDYLSVNLKLVSAERVRPTKSAATALLARVYLFVNDYINAEALSSLLIEDERFSLSNDLNAVFNNNSSEAIWQLSREASYNYTSAEGENFILTSTPGLVSLSSQITNAFEAGDNRFINWVALLSDETGNYNYPYKYKIQTSSSLTASREYTMVLRIAEQYLIRAEARINQTGKVSLGIDDINALRERARGAGSGDLPAISESLTKDQALQVLEHERQVELFTEWGHRWFDLKRTGRIEAVMSVVTPLKNGGTWNSYQKLFPVPQQERSVNPFLTQNSGYN